MKGKKHYRFSLQFQNDTSEKRMVGDFLDGLKSKKSRFIVSVIGAYLKEHPKLLKQTGPHEILWQSVVDEDSMQKLKKEMQEYINQAISRLPRASQTGVEPEAAKEDLNAMLQDMDVFREI